MPNSILANPPKYLRSQPSKSTDAKVDRTGGYRKAGIIRGVSVITAGEALGHDMWIDSTMVEQVSEAINQRNKGVKSRFTHPSMSGDGLGKHVGRIMDSEVSADGTQAIADQHFSESGHSTPDGDLAGYLMDLAEEDPEAYGLSIVFGLDEAAMAEFAAEFTDDRGTFTSPDPLNKNNYPHARLSELRAVDAVDEPAANPNGLFHRESEIVEQANAMAAFALGLTNETPHAIALGLDADRVRGFVSRFLTSNNLEIRAMAEPNEVEEATPETPVAPAEAEVETVEEVATPEPIQQVATSERSEAKRFQEAFGDKGAVWFAEGLSFEQATQRNSQLQEARIADLEKKLAAIGSVAGEVTPVDFDSADKKSRGGFAGKIRMPASK